MDTFNNVAVIGGGSWATALVKILSNNCHNIRWWLRNEESAEYIRNHHHNPSYLSDVEINPDRVKATTDLKECISESELIILAVPSAFVKDALSGIGDQDFRNKVVFSAIKGIVPDDLLIVGEFLNRHYNIPLENIGVITGPCHAEEVALEKLSYLTLACSNTVNASKLSELMNCRYIKSTVSDDIYGTEYAAVIKNIIAIASGICHGLRYGDNFQAVLISNSIQEIKRFIDAISPINRDINDSAYLGDLLVTAYSQFSRNRTFGNMIGRGYSVKSAQMEMNMVAEGYYAVKCIYELNKKHKISLPVCDAVYRVLYEQAPPGITMNKLSGELR